MDQLSGLAVQPRGNEPLYRQLFDQIVARIRNGTWPAGYRLPPTRRLAREVGAHRNTVVRAYEDLEAAGFVDSTVGRGTFVAVRVVGGASGAGAAGGARGGATRGDGPRGGAAGSGGSDPSLVATEPGVGGLPWASLVSNACLAEPLGRSARLLPAAGRGDGRKPTGPGRAAASDVIHLGRMQPSPDLIPDQLLRRCIDHVLRTQRARALGYAPGDGLPRLRERVAADLRRIGVPAAAEDLIITTGSQQAIDLVARALVNPGEPFLVDESTYSGALGLLSAAGARLLGLRSDEEGPDPAALERHARMGLKGFYLMPNCQNPTGARVSLARREALVAWSHRAGVPLIEDDYASDLHLDGQPPLPALRSLDGDVIYLGTYSKKLIPALRVGYLLCPRGLKARIGPLKYAMDLGTSSLIQHALAEFLERGYLEAHLRKVIREYRRRRDALETALARYLPSGVSWRRPETGVVLWLPTPPAIDPEAIFREAEQQGVLVSPSTLNGVEPRHQRGLRITFCSESPARLVEGAKRLGRAWTLVERRLKGTPARASLEIV